MDSSTWPRGFSERRQLLPAWLTVIGSPLLWLAALQAGYLLAYPACASGSLGAVHAVVLGTAGVLAVTAFASWRRWRAWSDKSPRDQFLAALGFIMAAGFCVVVLASEIPLLMLRPCD